MAWRFQVFARLSERQGLLGGEFSDFHGSLQLLTSSPPAGTRSNVVKGHFVWGVWNGFLLGKAKKEDVSLSFLW